MAERTRACEDADFIAARVAELRKERDAAFACSCEEVIDLQGNKTRSWKPSCQLHKPENACETLYGMALREWPALKDDRG